MQRTVKGLSTTTSPVVSSSKIVPTDYVLPATSKIVKNGKLVGSMC